MVEFSVNVCAMKKVIFLFRGLSREQGHWADFPESLKNKLPGFEVVKVDLPGFGFAHKEKAPYGMRQTALSIIERGVFKAYEDYDERYILGLSLGAMVSLQIVLEMPGYFNGAILLNPSQKYKNSVFNRIDFKFIPKAFCVMNFAGIMKREAMLYDKTINSGRERDFYIKEWTEHFLERPFKKASFFAQIIAAARFSLKGKDFKGARGVVLASKADRLVNWKSGKVISELLKWPIFYHNNAGHDLSFDDPLWICDKVNEFINKEI